MNIEYGPPLHTFKQSRLLYVVLQGEFALFHESTAGKEPDRLWIMAPYMRYHEYKAGPWLTDWDKAPDLPRDHRLRLRHIYGERKLDTRHCGRAFPENNSDIIMKLGRQRLCPDEARVVI